MAKTEADFLPVIRRLMRDAQAVGQSSVDIKAGDVHKEVGDYPNPRDHRTPILCRLMKNEMRPGDEILSSPPSGQGPTLTIRYKLSRR